MFSKTKRDANGELDEVGEELVRASRASDGEIEAAAGGALLYSRIRASIAAQQRASEGPAGSWMALLRAARLAVPAMALVTLVVTFVPRLSPMSKLSADKAAYYEEIPPPRAPGILAFAAGACALSNSEECAISTNEVLATLFADDNQEIQR